MFRFRRQHGDREPYERWYLHGLIVVVTFPWPRFRHYRATYVTGLIAPDGTRYAPFFARSMP